MAGARMLATAFVAEGKWASSFPEFGFERRGAPVQAFVRVDSLEIREKTKIYRPDCVIVLDPRLIDSKAVFDGLKPEGILVFNGSDMRAEIAGGLGTAGYVNATRIGLEEVGLAVTNTSMLGAFARVTGWVGLDAVFRGLKEYFSGKLLEKNMRCVERGFSEAKVVRYSDGA